MFFLFIISQYYPAGFEDYDKSYPTLEEAREAGKKAITDRSRDYYQILTVEGNELVLVDWC